MDRITYDDVYEIAAEVAEETLTKFLKNLIKLIPSAQETVEDIRETQQQELRELRALKKKGKGLRESYQPPKYEEEEEYYSGDSDEEDEEFEEIAHPKEQKPAAPQDEFDEIAHPKAESGWNPNMGLEDDVLGNIDLQYSGSLDTENNPE